MALGGRLAWFGLDFTSSAIFGGLVAIFTPAETVWFYAGRGCIYEATIFTVFTFRTSSRRGGFTIGPSVLGFALATAVFSGTICR